MPASAARATPSRRKAKSVSATVDAKPFLKWAGGKWSLAPRIAALLPDVSRRTYREPFLGGGAIYFYLKGTSPPKRAFLSDALEDLVLAYKIVRDDPEALITALEGLDESHSTTQYYCVREQFNARAGDLAALRAAWLIYLNKTCFNGLYRTNRAGHFNVPEGRFTKPRIVDKGRIRSASAALGGAKLSQRPFDHLLEAAEAGDVVYLDPPYVPLSKTSSFAAYSLDAFGPEDQARLAETFRTLDARGCMLALSNSDTREVRDLYKGYELTRIIAHRSISAQGSTRAPVAEVLVRNPKRYR